MSAALDARTFPRNHRDGRSRASSGPRCSTSVPRASSSLRSARDEVFTFEQTTHSDDIFAAAACRSIAFASSGAYADRSDFARRAKVAMKTEAESESLMKKLRLLGACEVGYESVVTSLIVARREIGQNGEIPMWFDARSLDPRCMSSREGFVMSIVAGSLDLNVGERLPAEELAGALSPGKRAYLSNVSVLPPVRRRGIAFGMINRALDVARDEFGVETVYVHAEASNSRAIALYEKIGFEMETREPDGVIVTHGRPPRVLFRRGTRTS
ncbi:GCN5-related N-acetyltransferase [Ostreococcus tauri]|uniref:GCN5-related N-acetyltransferase n=1 Tax=Ostreococcus tauri TaxID=70448 RepID=A0A1Y5IKV1_OSTTA|nr:GCN5-related N-acetyltransferase [Ostreococcus tauri]